MTALAVVSTAPLSPIPPVGWHRLAWVSWRRHRATLAATTAILAALAGYLVVTGHRLRSAYAAVHSCHPAESTACNFKAEAFSQSYHDLGLISIALVVLPGLLGAFAGAPLVARELETGSFRYTWTQGVGRTRWVVAIVLPGAVVMSLIAAAFGALVAWHNQPLVDGGVAPRLQNVSFPTTGVAVAGWTLLGFAIGVIAGLAWRRVVPALATTVGAWASVWFLTAEVIRPLYSHPLTTTGAHEGTRDLILNEWWTKGGVRATDGQINAVLRQIGVQAYGNGSFGQGNPGDPGSYLKRHGFQHVTSYLPDSRYWTYQWVEFGWLVALSALLLAAALWLVRARRV